MTTVNEITPAELIGELNEAEKKFTPAVLYYRGDLDISCQYPAISIIGSRRASEDGLKRAEALSRKIVKAGGVVLSGLAKGIDTAAHRAAINAGGKTIAVIGTSLTESYPKENQRLQEEIAKNHLLLSQFKEGVPTTKKNFPLRNRTMALLSYATIIVEASEKSGTIHQGWEAIRLNRPLFLMKSFAANSSYGWVQQFIEYGAQVLENTDDSLGALLDSLPVGLENEQVALCF